MAKKTKKTTEETRNITNNFSGFAIFGDAQAVENALVDTLEYGIELTERTERNLDVSSIALAQLITQRVNDKRLNALPSSPEVREIFRGIVEKHCTIEGKKDEPKIAKMMGNATTITRIALLIACGDATVGMTMKNSNLYLKKQPKAYDPEKHTRRIFLPENVPFSHKAVGEPFSSALKIATKDRLIDTFKANFLNETKLVEIDDNGEEYCTKFGKKTDAKNPESFATVSKEKAKSAFFDLKCFMNQSLWFSGDSVDKNERPQDKLFDGVSVDALGTLEFKTKDLANVEFSEIARNLFGFARDILEIEKKAKTWYEVHADFSESNGLDNALENDDETVIPNGVQTKKEAKEVAKIVAKNKLQKAS
tara:strand:+ start:24 stop:1118 length:1095 start_codon:yes stop_codon:yes gene_type:complete